MLILREENMAAGIAFSILGSLVWDKKLAITDAFAEPTIFFFVVEIISKKIKFSNYSVYIYLISFGNRKCFTQQKLK